MKKNLRLLCLGLATAATFSAGFAQTNVTHKLRNADMELGIKGWGVDGDSHLFGKNKKYQSSRPGFHGMNEGVLENWNGSGSALGDNSISQTVKNLPNGTYVFGAYVAASLQGSQDSNKDGIEGVTLFANEAGIPVATDNPDNGAKAKWAHSAKFNVATTVTDGTLNVGLNIESTNANYVVWDNATLYYFGSMDAAAALDAMAKIDMAATIAIADTCFAYKMNVDSLALITEAKAAAKTLATADQLWQLNEDLYWAIFKATRSLGDYRSFNNAITAAEVIAAGEWSSEVLGLDELNAAIVAAKATYAEATADRPALNEQKAALNEAAALVALDSCYIVIDELENVVIPELPNSDEVGEYSDAKIDALVGLVDEMRVAVDAACYEGTMTAVEARQEYNRLYAQVQAIIDNPNVVDVFPIVLGKSETALKGYKLLEGATTNSADVVTYQSKTYTFDFPLTRVRFIVKETGGNGLTGDYPFFTLSSFEMFDIDGNEIDLSTSNLTSNACHNTLNPGNSDGAGIEGLVDDEPGTFFHSTWGTAVSEHHYLEVTLPEGEYTAFSFAMTARGTGHPHQFPAVLEIVHLSDAASDLLAAIASAKSMNAYQGTAPGFYNADLSSFYAALAHAEALAEDGNASESAIYNAIAALEKEQEKIDELSVVMPEPGKQYRIVSAAPFFEKQGVHKAWTIHGEDNQIWWSTAHPDSVQQLFTFEVLPNDEGKDYYIMKNVSKNLYVGTPLDADGDETNTVGLLAVADTVELESLGYGQFGLINSGMVHAGDHNSGVASTNAGAYGGIYGVSSGMCKWTTGAYNASAWYIREMQSLPYATKNVSDLNFQSESINLFEGVNTLTLTADKNCRFSDLVVYGVLGEVIPASVTVSGASATVLLDATVESFSFTFANAEGVQTVTVDGSISMLSELQAAYDAAKAVAPVAGTGIMQYSDLTAYNRALSNAKNLLAYGASEEQIVAAIAQLEEAVAGLTPNYPSENKTYFIVSALEAFAENHGVNMMLYANNEGTPKWMYENVDNENRLWQFEPAEVEEGAPAAFYIKNVATGTYIGKADAQSTEISMADATSATVAYNIISLEGTTVAIQAVSDSKFRLHANGHGNGGNKIGNIVYWNAGLGTSSAWTICESEEYIEMTDIDFTELESGDQIAPAQKGIYDLFGRRIVAPAAVGIYIVDGKKKVVK